MTNTPPPSSSSGLFIGFVLLCLCSSSAAGAYFYNRKDAKYYENEMASPDELSENAKNLISAIEQFDDGFSPEKCKDFKEKWEKVVDGRKLNEIFDRDKIKDPEINFIYSTPKYKEVIQTLGEAFAMSEDIPDSELPPGVTRVEQSDEEIINKFCISDLKRKIDEKVTLLKNEDIQGCNLYDDTWNIIRGDWNTGFVWNDSNDKILVAHKYAYDALGETDETVRTMTTFKETLCAPPPSPLSLIDDDESSPLSPMDDEETLPLSPEDDDGSI